MLVRVLLVSETLLTTSHQQNDPNLPARLPQKTALAVHLDHPEKNRFLTMEKKHYDDMLREATRKVAVRDSKRDAVHLHRFDEEHLKQVHYTLVQDQQERAGANDGLRT